MSAPSDDLPPMPAELADYLDAFREVERPSAPAVERTWQAIESRTAEPKRTPWIPVMFALAAVLVGAVVVDWSRGTERDERPRDDAQTPYHREPAVSGGEATPRIRVDPPRPRPPEVRPEPQTKAQPPPDSAVAARPVTVPTSRPRAKPRPPEPSGPTALAEETALLGQMQDARARGAHARVLELATEHRRRFAAGTFAAERTLAEAQALCALGRIAEGQALARRFLARHARSHLAPQFESLCDG